MHRIAVLLAAVSTLGAIAAPPTARQVHAGFAGHWTGTLRYRDYQDSSRFVTLPTQLDATVAPDSSFVTLDFTYDDGPGKTVRDRDQLDLDVARRTVRWGSAEKADARSRYDVTSLEGGAAGQPIRLGLERDGQDDNRPARMRESVTIGPSEIRILKEVRFAPGAQWIFRHEYRFAPRQSTR
ncbi:MAG: hypothetical protein HY275_14805 [Gemmatimonadetes bacterium]|nr:hypothetical protein [Gemmatimonadota bacterium]